MVKRVSRKAASGMFMNWTVAKSRKFDRWIIRTDASQSATTAMVTEVKGDPYPAATRVIPRVTSKDASRLAKNPELTAAIQNTQFITTPNGEKCVLLSVGAFHLMIEELNAHVPSKIFSQGSFAAAMKGVRGFTADFVSTIEENDGDVAAADAVKAEIEDGKEELIPSKIAEHLIFSDDSPVKAWREIRGMTQKELAEKAGVAQSQISMIESGRREGGLKSLRAIAETLDVLIDDLV